MDVDDGSTTPAGEPEDGWDERNWPDMVGQEEEDRMRDLAEDALRRTEAMEAARPHVPGEELDPFANSCLLRKQTRQDAENWAPEKNLQQGQVAGDIVLLSPDHRNPALFLFDAGDGWKMLRLKCNQSLLDDIFPWNPMAPAAELLRAVLELDTKRPEEEPEATNVDGRLNAVCVIGEMLQADLKATLRNINSVLLPLDP